MIFVTVGSQMPFDRLVESVSDWATAQAIIPDILAQVGDTQFRAAGLRSVPSLTPEEFRRAVRDAEVIVAHAGMGSVLTALEFGKPLVVLPRRGALRETRNDHQIATARWLSAKENVFVAMETAELSEAIGRARTSASQGPSIDPFASVELLAAIRIFIHS